MKNLKKGFAVLACASMAFTLTGCGGGSSSAKYTKVGFGMITSVSEKEGYNQINTTMATVGVDKDGKIQYVDLDVAQNNTNDTSETRTKKEKKEDYGMKSLSEKMGIGKEWYEQVDYLEEKLIGMTKDDVTKIETYKKDEEHDSVPAEGTDIATGCTINIGAFQKAIAKAFDNMEEVSGAEKIGAGEVIKVADDTVNTTAASVALDKAGKIVWSSIDVAQTKDASETRSKLEKKDDYGMKGLSEKMGIGKEWYEQVGFLKEKLVGMTKDDVAKIKTYKKDEEHDSVPAEGTDIATGCTINIGDFQEALAEAFDTAK